MHQPDSRPGILKTAWTTTRPHATAAAITPGIRVPEPRPPNRGFLDTSQCRSKSGRRSRQTSLKLPSPQQRCALAPRPRPNSDCAWNELKMDDPWVLIEPPCAASQKRELDWLVDELRETLTNLRHGLEDCYALLAPIDPGSTLVLSTPRNEAVKGHVTRVGTRIVKGVSLVCLFPHRQAQA